MLEERGHKFVRYADDCNIYVKSGRAAQRVMEGCVKFLEGKLKLKVNRKKSTTGSLLKLKFLGFSLYRRKDGIGIRVHEKPLQRLMDRLRGLTRRDDGTDTGGTDAAFDRLVRILQYCRPEGTSETDKRLVEAADTADVQETLETETGTDAM
jgi:hypothetical protein